MYAPFLLCLFLLGLWTTAAWAGPLEWGQAPPTVAVEGGTVVADCGGVERGDAYLLSQRDYENFLLEWDLTRLAAAPDVSRERAIVVWAVDREDPANRRSYFLTNWNPPVGQTVHVALAVVDGRAQLWMEGQLKATDGSADYGQPPPRGAVGLLHYFWYRFRHENVRLWDLSAGEAPSLGPPQAEVLPTGAVRVTWESPPALRQIARYELFRDTWTRPYAVVRGAEFIDRDTRPGQTVAYRVRLRLSDTQTSPLSEATERTIRQVQPPLPPHKLTATGRLDGSVRVTWELEPDTRAGEVIILGSMQPFTEAGAPGVIELARCPTPQPLHPPTSQPSVLSPQPSALSPQLPNSGSLVVAGSQRYIGLLVTDPAGEPGTTRGCRPATVEVQPHAPLRPGGVRLPDRHPCLLYTAEDFAKVRAAAEKRPEVRRLVEGYVRAGEEWLGQDVVIPGKVQSTGEASAGESQGHYSMADRAQALGYAYALSGDERFAAKAREILLGYADVYLTFPVTNGRCRAMSASGLWESIWYVRLLLGYDLVYDSGVFSAEDRRHIEQDLLRPCVSLFVVKDYDDAADPRAGDLHYKCYNFQAWFDAAVGMTGLLLRDPDLFEYALDSTYGLKHLIAHDLYDDGLFWERSIGYHHFVKQALHPLLEAAWHHGYDLYHLKVPDDLQEPISSNYFMDGDHGPKSLQLLWDAPFYFQFADGRFPVIGDSSAGPLRADETIWTGWARYGDPKLLWLLQKEYGRGGGGLPSVLFGPLPEEPATFEIGNASFANIGVNRCGSTLFPSAGFAILRENERDPRSIGVALTYGPFGGGHGHPDKLSLVLHGLGGEPITDFGSCSYASPLKSTWTHQTVTHNTIVVDGRTQATETTGKLDFFHADTFMRAVRAHDDQVYPGVHLERTVILLGSVVVDLFRAESDTPHTYDYVLHIDGELQDSTADLQARAEPLGTANGYQHLEEVRSAVVEGDWQGVWVGPTAKLATTLLGDGPTEVCAARSLTDSEDRKMPLLLARRTAARTTFVTVLDAHADQPRAAEVRRLGPTALSLRIDGAPVYLLWDAAEFTAAGPLTARATLACVREAADGVDVPIRLNFQTSSHGF